MIQENLRSELNSELEELARIEFGSEEYKVGASCFAQLADRYVELSKLEIEDRKLDIEQNKIDIEYKKLENEENDRKAKNRISAWSTVLPSLIAVFGAIAMFIYEERGSITSQAGRKIIDKYIFRVK